MRRDVERAQGRWRLFDDVFDTLEWEPQRADKDLRRLTAAAAYLREHYYYPQATAEARAEDAAVDVLGPEC